MPAEEVRRGLVALGDSITRGRGGSAALGVHFQSWAQWLAEAAALPLTNLAADGAVAEDVLAAQVPRLAGPYDVAVLYAGVNDARSLDWEPEAFERTMRAIVAALRACAARVLVLTLPEDLGRPRAAPKPAQANAIIRALDAEVVDLSGFAGRRNLLPDAVHPTSLGMLAIARAAAAVLGGAGPLPPRAAVPARARLRYEAWWGRLWLRDVARRTRERHANTGEGV